MYIKVSVYYTSFIADNSFMEHFCILYRVNCLEYKGIFQSAIRLPMVYWVG